MRERYELLGGGLLTCVEKTKDGRCARYLPTCQEPGGKCLTESPAHPTTKRKKTRKKKRAPSTKKPEKKTMAPSRKMAGKAAPWQMTRDEWTAEWESIGKRLSEEAGRGHTQASYKESDKILGEYTGLAYGAEIWDRKRGGFNTNHLNVVAKAVLEGKKVPARVLKDYPEIKEYAAGEVFRLAMENAAEIRQGFAEGQKEKKEHLKNVERERLLKAGRKLSGWMSELEKAGKKPTLTTAYTVVYGGKPMSSEAMYDIKQTIRDLGYADLDSMMYGSLKGERIVKTVTFTEMKLPFTVSMAGTLLMTFRVKGKEIPPGKVPTSIRNKAESKLLPKGVYKAPKRGIDTAYADAGLSGILLTCAEWQIKGKGEDERIRCKTYLQTCRPGDSDCAPTAKQGKRKKAYSKKEKEVRHRMMLEITEGPRRSADVAEGTLLNPDWVRQNFLEMESDGLVAVKRVLKRKGKEADIEVSLTDAGREALWPIEANKLTEAEAEVAFAVRGFESYSWTHLVERFPKMDEVVLRKTLDRLTVGGVLRQMVREGEAGGRWRITPKGEHLLSPRSKASAPKKKPEKKEPSEPTTEKLTADERKVWEALSTSKIHIDEVGRRSGLPAYKVSGALVMLELKGKASQSAGKMFARKEGAALGSPIWFGAMQRTGGGIFHVSH